MPKIAKELSALDVRRLKNVGSGGNSFFAVGGVAGLMLQITPGGGRSWVLRVTVGDKRRELGLGSFPETGLAEAREIAREMRARIRSGVDPLAEKRLARAELIANQKRALSFRDAVEKYLTAHNEKHTNAKHRAQWRSTLETYAMPELGPMLVLDIEVRDILRVLEPIWQSKTETASRLRGRIEAVLSWATVAGFREGDNPARWQGNLKELLPAPARVAKQTSLPALQIEDAPRWFEALKGRSGGGARAVEFAALTAARSSEVRGAVWSEIDCENAIWIVPASRMKMDREHRVPLSSEAMALLSELPRNLGSDLIFPAKNGGQMSDMTLGAVMRRIHRLEVEDGRAGFIDRVSKRPAVPHGLRSTFRDWVAERTQFPGDMAEMALAHKVASAVEASYRRGDMLEKRRLMMDAWSRHLMGVGGSSAEIIPFAKLA